jgi:hypothetical protein
MDPEVLIAGLALLAAIFAGVTSWRAYKASYRPILRVVPLFAGDDSGGETWCPDRLVLKNIGRGPAVSIVIVKGNGSESEDLIGEVDALEPLGQTYGPEFKESGRVGRVKVQFDKDALQENGSYRVLYVDVAGGWHETSFKVENKKFKTKIVEPFLREHIPQWVKNRSQIVTAIEDLDYGE